MRMSVVYNHALHDTHGGSATDDRKLRSQSNLSKAYGGTPRKEIHIIKMLMHTLPAKLRLRSDH